MALTNFGQQFAVKTLRKFYQNAVTPIITNSNYEGDIKKAGDRVNILSFLNDIAIGAYTVGTDMSLESIVDANDQLVIDTGKFYNFPIDRVEDLFTYGDDIADNLVENAAKVLERTIDTYTLNLAGQAKAGNWVGVNLFVAGNNADTMASINTTAAGGTLTAFGDAGLAAGTTGAHTVEGQDGNSYYSGFTTNDVGKPIRLVSTRSWVTPWYKITAWTDSVTISVTNWDGAASGSDIPTGDVLRGLGGGDGTNFAQNTDGKVTTQAGWGWEFQAAAGTSVANTTIYNAVIELAQKLDQEEIPDTDRHLTVPPAVLTQLKEASQLQPTGIAEIYSGVVLNGKVMRMAGFDIHLATGSRLSTRAEHAPSVGTGADTVLSTATLRTQILANHTSFITFAYKWAESRIVDAESQFAKKYQGLHLYGAIVPALRRKAGAILFASF